MTAADGEVFTYRLSLRRPYRTARGVRRAREGALLRLRSEDGTEGWGEAAPLPGRTEAPADAVDELRSALDALRGEPWSPGNGAVPERLSPGPGRPAACFALGTAAADLVARGRGRSLAEQWAAAHELPGRPAAEVPVNATLPMSPPEEVADRAREATERGIRCFKLKVGGQETEDLRRLAAVRKAVGPDAGLRVDANEAWSWREARSRLLRLEPYGLDYVEQPLARDDLDGLARLRRETGTDVRIAADEGAGSLEAVRNLLERSLVDVLVLKPMVLGPPSATLRAVRLARDAGVEPVLTTALGAAVARAATLHLAAAAGATGELSPCGLLTGELLAEDVGPAQEVRDGALPVPDADGLGFVPAPPAGDRESAG